MNHLRKLILQIFNALNKGLTMTPTQVYYFVNAYETKYTLKQVHEEMNKMNGKYLEKVGDKRKTTNATYKLIAKTLNKLKDYY